MFISKADCIAWDYNYIVSKALGCFWSFMKLYMHTQIETFMYAITLKGEISNWNAIVYRKTEQFRSKGQNTSKVSSKKKNPDCRHRWPDMYSTAITLMDILKQAIAKNWLVEFKRQAKEQKQREAPRDFVYTPSRIKHSFTQCSCYFGCDR